MRVCPLEQFLKLFARRILSTDPHVRSDCTMARRNRLIQTNHSSIVALTFDSHLQHCKIDFRCAACAAMTVEQHAARDALKNQPGLGPEKAAPPNAVGISVSIRSPEGPVTRHFSPLSSEIVAGVYLARALSGWARSVSLKVFYALAIGESVTKSLLDYRVTGRHLARSSINCDPGTILRAIWPRWQHLDKIMSARFLTCQG